MRYLSCILYKAVPPDRGVGRHAHTHVHLPLPQHCRVAPLDLTSVSVTVRDRASTSSTPRTSPSPHPAPSLCCAASLVVSLTLPHGHARSLARPHCAPLSVPRDSQPVSQATLASGLIKPRARSPVRGAAPLTPRKRLTGSTRTRPSRPSRKAASASCSPGTRRERWRTRPPRIGIASTSLDRGPPPERAGRRPRSTRPPPRPRYTACARGKSNEMRGGLFVCALVGRVTSSPYMPAHGFIANRPQDADP